MARRIRPDPNTVANALDALQARVRPTFPPSVETFAELRARPEFVRAFEVPGTPAGGVLLYAESEIEGATVPIVSATVLLDVPAAGKPMFGRLMLHVGSFAFRAARALGDETSDRDLLLRLAEDQLRREIVRALERWEATANRAVATPAGD